MAPFSEAIFFRVGLLVFPKDNPTPARPPRLTGATGGVLCVWHQLAEIWGLW